MPVEDCTYETTTNGKNYKLILLDSPLIKEYRDTLERYVERFRLYDPNITSEIIDDIITEKINNNIWLIIIDSKLEAIGLTSYPDRDTIFIRAIAGWISNILNFKSLFTLFLKFANKYKFTKIQFCGREGWGILLKEFSPIRQYFYTIEVTPWAEEKAEEGEPLVPQLPG